MHENSNVLQYIENNTKQMYHCSWCDGLWCWFWLCSVVFLFFFCMLLVQAARLQYKTRLNSTSTVVKTVTCVQLDFDFMSILVAFRASTVIWGRNLFCKLWWIFKTDTLDNYFTICFCFLFQSGLVDLGCCLKRTCIWLLMYFAPSVFTLAMLPNSQKLSRVRRYHE